MKLMSLLYRGFSSTGVLILYFVLCLAEVYENSLVQLTILEKRKSVLIRELSLKRGFRNEK